MNSFAQSAPAGRTAPGTDKTELKELKIRLTDGNNTITIPDGRGTIKFVKRGDKISIL